MSICLAEFSREQFCRTHRAVPQLGSHIICSLSCAASKQISHEDFCLTNSNYQIPTTHDSVLAASINESYLFNSLYTSWPLSLYEYYSRAVATIFMSPESWPAVLKTEVNPFLRILRTPNGASSARKSRSSSTRGKRFSHFVYCSFFAVLFLQEDSRVPKNSSKSY